jgi:hypothetical protein
MDVSQKSLYIPESSQTPPFSILFEASRIKKRIRDFQAGMCFARFSLFVDGDVKVLSVKSMYADFSHSKNINPGVAPSNIYVAYRYDRVGERTICNRRHNIFLQT